MCTIKNELNSNWKKNAAFSRISGFDVLITFLMNAKASASDSKIEDGRTMIVHKHPDTREKKSMMFKVFNFHQIVKFLDDKIHFDYNYYGILSPRNCIFFKLLRDNVEMLFEGGIIQNFKTIKITSSKVYNENFEVIEPKLDYWIVLNLTILESGFVIWLVSVALSVLVFIAEIIHYHLSRFILKFLSKRKNQKVKTVRIIKNQNNRKCKKKLKIKKKMKIEKNSNFCLQSKSFF